MKTKTIRTAGMAAFFTLTAINSSVIARGIVNFTSGNPYTETTVLRHSANATQTQLAEQTFKVGDKVVLRYQGESRKQG
ncbi:MAG: hypothetical protein ACI8WB_001472 [Phenylobacterium sp.]|jgi:hypothetical protein